jgi:hypothetical protein
MGTNNGQRGSSLVEVLLVIAVMVMLAGASVISFSSQLQRSSLAEGVSRVQSMLRFARAEAANSGHKVQIQFAPTRGTNLANSADSLYEPKISCELDPLNAPGVFSEMQDIAWMDESISDLVQIESVRPLDAEEPETAEGMESGIKEEQVVAAVEGGEPPAITFYPDGSSDSVGIVLISTDSEDARRVQLKLVGLTGSIEENSLEEEVSETCEPLAPPDRTARDVSSK